MDREQEPVPPPPPSWLKGISIKDLLGSDKDPRIGPADFETMVTGADGKWKDWSSAFGQFVDSFYGPELECWLQILTADKSGKRGLVDRMLGRGSYKDRPSIYQKFLDELTNIKKGGRPRRPPSAVNRSTAFLKDIKDSIIASGNSSWFSSIEETAQVLEGIRSLGWQGAEHDYLKRQIIAFREKLEQCSKTVDRQIALVSTAKDGAAAAQEAEQLMVKLSGEYGLAVNTLVEAYFLCCRGFRDWITATFTAKAKEHFAALFDDEYQSLFAAKAIGGTVGVAASITAGPAAAAAAAAIFGAGVGAAAGTVLLPGIGTVSLAAIGAVAGCIVGGIATLVTLSEEGKYKDKTIAAALADPNNAKLWATGIATRDAKATPGEQLTTLGTGTGGDVFTNVGSNYVSTLGGTAGSLAAAAGVGFLMAGTVKEAADYYSTKHVDEEQQKVVYQSLALVSQGLRARFGRPASSSPATESNESDDESDEESDDE